MLTTTLGAPPALADDLPIPAVSGSRKVMVMFSRCRNTMYPKILLYTAHRTVFTCIFAARGLQGKDGFTAQILSTLVMIMAAVTQQTLNICITFLQRRPNVFDVDPTLCKWYTNVLCLLENHAQVFPFEISTNTAC